MSDADKNLHLSPLLDKIRDYGPGDVPDSDQEGPPEPPPETVAEPPPRGEPETAQRQARDAGRPAAEAESDSAARAAQESREAPAATPPQAKSSNLAVYSLVALWLLTLAGGFGAFVWQQTRIDALSVELREARGKARDLAALAEREATRLSDRVEELSATIEDLRSALSDAQAEAAVLAIASVQAPQPPEPASAMTAGNPELPAPAPELPAAAKQTSGAVSESLAEAATDEEPEPQTDLQTTGSWYINLSTLSSEAAARRWLSELAGAPERAEIIAIQSGGKTLYRVRVGGYQSREDALDAARNLGVNDAWASSG